MKPTKVDALALAAIASRPTMAWTKDPFAPGTGRDRCGRRACRILARLRGSSDVTVPTLQAIAQARIARRAQKADA